MQREYSIRQHNRPLEDVDNARYCIEGLLAWGSGWKLWRVQVGLEGGGVKVLESSIFGSVLRTNIIHGL